MNSLLVVDSKGAVAHWGSHRTCTTPAHNGLYQAGIDSVLEIRGAGLFNFVRRRSPSSDDSPRIWSRSRTYTSLYDALVIIGRGYSRGASLRTPVS